MEIMTRRFVPEQIDSGRVEKVQETLFLLNGKLNGVACLLNSRHTCWKQFHEEICSQESESISFQGKGFSQMTL